MRYSIIFLVVVGLFSNCLLAKFINGAYLFQGLQALPWKNNAFARIVVILFGSLLGQRNIRPTTPTRITSTTLAQIATGTIARSTSKTQSHSQSTSTSALACPAGYSLYNESCGRFCYRYEANDCNDWDNARVACQAEGGDLLAPSECNYQFFREQAQAIVGNCASNFWLGSLRPTNGADFITVKGDPILNTANFWNLGEPNNAGGIENCLEMSGNANFLANDQTCSNINGYICQIII